VLKLVGARVRLGELYLQVGQVRCNICIQAT